MTFLAGIAFVVAAAAASWAGIYALVPLLSKHGAAIPNDRSSHKIPTPQGAGISVVITTLIATAIAFAFTGLSTGYTVHIIAVAGGAVALVGLGILDDIRQLAVVPRIAVQIFVVLLAVITLPAEVRVIPALPFWSERLLIVIAGLWFVNLYNFMDGIDLMAAGETLCLSACVIILSATGAVPGWLAWSGGALAGATAGFLPWNRPPARMFLGDSGSLALGFLTGIMLVHVAGAAGLLVGLIPPLYFVMDATVTVCRRIGRGEPFWLGHRQHFYQRAIDNGWSATRIVATVTALNVCLIGLTIGAAAGAWTGSAALVVGAACVVGTLMLFARSR
jgi:UDP-N-acetylmuramyl pentapeptide phosphotransferase/UDP-N-acetylglucosamine-1-phosphate transferase